MKGFDGIEGVGDEGAASCQSGISKRAVRTQLRWIRPLIWFRSGVRDCGLVWLACELAPLELRVSIAVLAVGGASPTPPGRVFQW